MRNIISKIEKELKNPLPGIQFQAKLAPFSRLKNYNPNPPGAKRSAVLLLLFPFEDELYITFIKRTNDGGVHSSQISFPGGKFEKKDQLLKNTALRETYEEIGIPEDKIDIIGNLSSLFISVSNFVVHPFVGYCVKKPEFNINETEVDRIITQSVDRFLDEKNIKTGNIKVRNTEIKSRYYQLNKDKLWGATAMIMSEFSEILNRIKP